MPALHGSDAVRPGDAPDEVVGTSSLRLALPAMSGGLDARRRHRRITGDMGATQEAGASRGPTQGRVAILDAERRQGWAPMTHFIVSDVTDLKRMLPGWARPGDTCTCTIIEDRVLIACIGHPDEIDDDESVLSAGCYAWVLLADSQEKIDEHMKHMNRIVNLTIARAKA